MLNTWRVSDPAFPPPLPTLGGRARPEAGRLATGALALLATNALAVSIPWLLKDAIDVLRRGGADARGAVVRDAVLIGVFAILQAGIRTAARSFVSRDMTSPVAFLR